jgi:hypothetical protein
MKVSVRLLAMTVAAMTIAFAISTTTAHAQFPVCTSGDLTIKNYSGDKVTLCLKYADCYDVGPNDGISVTLTPGQELPGVYGPANVTHEWTSPSPMPPMLWIESQATDPSGNCFDIYFDEATCTILIYPSATSPCLNP